MDRLAAIKELCQRSGLSLSDAARAIDAYVTAHPSAPWGVVVGALAMESSDTLALRDELSTLRAQFAEAQAEMNMWRTRYESINELLDDSMRRFNILYDGWRAAKSNDELADVLTRALFDWPDAASRGREG